MSENREISQQEHEKEYLLRQLNKSQSEENKETMSQIIKDFKKSKGGPHSKNYDREEFLPFVKKSPKYKKLKQVQKRK